MKNIFFHNTIIYIFIALMMLLMFIALWKMLRLPRGMRLAGVGININADFIANIVIVTVGLFSFVGIASLSFYSSVRYVFFSAPVLFVMLVGFLHWTLSLFLTPPRKILICLQTMCVFFILVSVAFTHTTFLKFNQNEAHQKMIDESMCCYGIVFGGAGMRSPITQELFPIMTLEEVYATKYENSQSLEQILAGKDTSNGLIVWIDNRKECLGEYTVEQVISNALKSAGFTKAVPLYQFEITDVFYLTGPEGI